MNITPGHCNGIPGHCIIIPGHYIRRLRCWEVTGWNRGCLARKGVMNLYETTFMQRRGHMYIQLYICMFYHSLS